MSSANPIVAAAAGTGQPSDAAHLRAWAQWAAQASPGENRELAVKLMKRCLAGKSDVLMLPYLGLRSLPALLPPCSVLQISGNALQALPVTLPDGLKRLSLYCEPELRQLPATLPDLNSLKVLSTGVCSLPRTLPATLREVDIQDNPLASLPDLLPPLEVAFFNRNRFTAMPASVFSLPASCNVYFYDNLLTHEVQQQVRQTLCAPDYCGPDVRL